ncbi:MAG: transglycosylase SLT domain-containing protein [Acidobacteriota bacterium]
MILSRVAASAVSVALAAAFLSAGTVQSSDPQARAALAPPVQLEVTSHPALPDQQADLWFVPTGKSRRSAALVKFAEGVRAYAEGNFEAALPLVSAPALADTLLADYATYYKGLTLVRLNRVDEARQVLSSLKDRPLRGYLVEASVLARGEAAELANDARAAAVLYQDLTTSKPLDPQVAAYRLWRSLLASGDRAGAAAAWQRLRYEFPLSAEAAQAETEVEKLGDLAPVPAESTFKLELGRAERLFGARRYSQARDAFGAIENLASGEDRELVELRLAESDFYLRRYAAARDALRPYLTRASRSAEAQFFYLATLNELESDEEYLARVRALVDAYPNSSWSEEALNNLGTHYILANDDEAAAGAFRELLQRFPNGSRAERAAWKLGWWEYKNGRYAETVRIFESAAATFPRSDYRPSWVYWAARGRERAGDQSNAVARYRLVTADYLNSYYGRLATRRLAGLDKVALAAFTPPASPSPRSSEAATQPPPTVDLIKVLLSLGLEADALNELRYAQRQWGSSPAIEATIAWAYYRQGDLRRAITQMKRAYPQHLTPEGSSRLPEELLRVIFPLDYWDSIQRRSRQRNLDPYVVAALIAQESSFEADAHSAANAYGLMQVVPGTGRRLARSLGIRYRGVTTLTNADANVRMGTLYFSRLIGQFGDVHLALAAYNAGESRVVRWIAERPGLDRDEFIDDIPFPETQNYVKKILGTAEDYRVLYGQRRARAVIDRDEPGAPAPAPSVKKPQTTRKAPAHKAPPKKKKPTPK